MFSWLRRVLGSNERTSSSEPTGPVASPCIPKMTATITVSVVPREKRPAEFQSAALRQLWNDVREWSHPDHPFLDASYSPGSNMPCADFTLWVAQRLAANDWTSILELLDCTTSEHQISALRRSFNLLDFGRFIEADSALLLELKAAAILGYRIGWMGHEDSRLSLLEDIYQQCLASYPFTIRQSALPHLLSGANRLIRKRNREGMSFGENLLAEDQLTSFPEISSAAETLRKFPPTFGACLTLSLQRGSSIPGTILPRFHGEYGLRQYGLSEEQNREFFVECGFFEPASDLHALSRSLTKEILREIATTNHIEVKKSWKKDRILSALLENGEARAAISARAATGFVQCRAGMGDPFGSWQARIISVQPIARCLACA